MNSYLLDDWKRDQFNFGREMLKTEPVICKLIIITLTLIMLKESSSKGPSYSYTIPSQGNHLHYKGDDRH